MRRFDSELRDLHQSLRSRHTGIYKWFQTYMKKAIQENSLEFDEFSMAVKALNCYQVTDVAIQEFFTQLDRLRRHRVSISDIEGLFKEH